MISPNGRWSPARELRIPTAAAMQDLGRELAKVLRAGDLVILAGPLGAGKTTLVQGIGEGLGVRGPVTSPTFVIARVHPAVSGPGPALVHADAYRLHSIAEVDDLDLDADLERAVTVVEWGEGLAEGLAEDRLEISIQPESADGDTRTVRITGHGARWNAADESELRELSRGPPFIVPLYFDARPPIAPEACRDRAGIPAAWSAGQARWPWTR
jgi:tRNA threonylcarbamoyladenosine biosynthesis protein TsaE